MSKNLTRLVYPSYPAKVCLIPEQGKWLVPVQVFPSPVQPDLHEQVNDLSVLVQSAFVSQSWVFAVHSSTPGEKQWQDISYLSVINGVFCD